MSRYPKKLFYKIGEVCELCGVEPHVLRYWESEFTALAPTRNRSGQRIYRQKDLETVETIKRLLYEEGYTIAGAVKQLAQTGVACEELPLFSRKSRKVSPAQLLTEIKQALQELMDMLGEVKQAPGVAEGKGARGVEEGKPRSEKSEAKPAAEVTEAGVAAAGTALASLNAALAAAESAVATAGTEPVATTAPLPVEPEPVAPPAAINSSAEGAQPTPPQRRPLPRLIPDLFRRN